MADPTLELREGEGLLALPIFHPSVFFLPLLMLVPLGSSPSSATDLGVKKDLECVFLVSNLVEYLEEKFSTLLCFICLIHCFILSNFGKFWAPLKSSRVQTLESFFSLCNILGVSSC